MHVTYTVRYVKEMILYCLIKFSGFRRILDYYCCENNYFVCDNDEIFSFFQAIFWLQPTRIRSPYFYGIWTMIMRQRPDPTEAVFPR